MVVSIVHIGTRAIANRFERVTPCLTGKHSIFFGFSIPKACADTFALSRPSYVCLISLRFCLRSSVSISVKVRLNCLSITYSVMSLLRTSKGAAIRLLSSCSCIQLYQLFFNIITNNLNVKARLSNL